MIILVSLLGSYLGKNVVYNFINSMIEESKYCKDLMKKDFNKKLKKMIKILKTLLNAGFAIMFILMVILK